MSASPPEAVFPTTRELRHGYEAALEHAKAGGYAELGNLSALAVEPDRSNMSLASSKHQSPMVQFVADGVFNVLSTIADRLPLEIAQRSAIARYSSLKMAMLTAGYKTHTHVINSSEALRRTITEDEWLVIEDMREYSCYLGALTSNVFFESSNTIGGAHRLLVNQEPDLQPLPVIERSTGLLATAGVRSDRVRMIWERLGFPYTRAEHLTLKEREAENLKKVDFITKTLGFIRKHSGTNSGCPIRHMAAIGGRGTVLTQNWIRLAGLFVPEGATTDVRNTRLPDEL